MSSRRTPAQPLSGVALAVACLACVLPGRATAAPVCTDFWQPTQPITILVPRSGAAGANRLNVTVARAIEAAYPKVKMQIVNRLLGDPTGRLALAYYATLPPNGQVVLQDNDDLVATSVSESSRCDRLGFDPLALLTPVAMVQSTFSQLYLRPGRYRDVAALRAAGASGRIRIAHSGNVPSLETVQLDVLAAAWSAQIEKLPVESKSSRYIRLFRDEVDAIIDQPEDVRDLLEKELIEPVVDFWDGEPPGTAPRPVAQAGGAAAPAASYRNMRRLRGYFVHAATPPERVKFFACVFERAYVSKEMRELNGESYMKTTSPEYEAAFLGPARARAELERMRGIYQEFGGTRGAACR